MSDDIETNVPDWAQEGYDPTATENSSRYIQPLYSELLDFFNKTGYNPHVDDEGNPITDSSVERGTPPSETAVSPELEPAPPPSETAVSPYLLSSPPPSETAVVPRAAQPSAATSTTPRSATPPSSTPAATQRSAPVSQRSAAPAAAESGFLSKLFSGPDYQSNNRPVIENGKINWGNPDNPADFARASKVMTAMQYGDKGAAPQGKAPSGGESRVAEVDPRLTHILAEAKAYLPKGYSMELTSGHRPTGGGFHPKGMAADVVIIDPDGNRLANYQDPRFFSVYEDFARKARLVQQELYPELGKALRWGGYFSGGKGKYGALDLMHFDLGGEHVGMAGGSWESGLTPEQRRTWGIAARAEGGRVELLQDQFPTHYLPNVGRQVMADGGDADIVKSALQKLYELEGRDFQPAPVVERREEPVLKPLDETSMRFGDAEDVKLTEMPYREQMQHVYDFVRPTERGTKDAAALTAAGVYGAPMDILGLVHGAKQILGGRIPEGKEMELPGGSHDLEQRAKERGYLSEEPSGGAQAAGFLGTLFTDPLAAASKVKMIAAAPMVGRMSRGADNAVEAAMRALPKAEDDASKALELARGTAAKNDVVSDLTGAFAPEKNPIRGGTGLEILEMQRKELSPIEQDKLNDLRAKNPDFARASVFLLPGELKTVIANPAQIEPMMRLLDVIPESAHMASLAKAGAPKQGWYRGSTQALIDVFGNEDAPRFAALLAATSPQTSVESNLMNTLNIWKNWEAAGRPTDPVQIKRVMGQSVQGTKGEDSILDAWVNNSIRALSAEDPRKIVLSGPKVNSFFRNLADDVYRVTNDAWISNATNIDQGLLRLSPTALQLAQGNPGLSPGYLALSTRQREGGNMVKMLPSESQETIWSVAMPLMEGARKEGISARDFLQRGLLTPDAIRGTPDFSTLLRERPEYATIIRDMGRGEQLDKMQPFSFPRTLPQLTDQDQRYLEKTAATLDELKGRRERESRALVQGYSPENERTFAHMTLSGMPGRGTGIAEKLIDAEPGSRANFSSRVSKAFQDQVGHDIINKALGLDTVATVPTTEVWRPYAASNATPTGMATSMAHSRAPEGLLETGKTGYTTSVEVPVERSPTGRNPRLPKDIERKLQVSATIHGGMTGQLGSPYHALIGDDKGLGTAYRMPKDMPAGEYQQNVGRVGALVDEPFAVADVGRGVNTFPYGDVTKMTDAERKHIQNMLGAESAQPVKNIAGPNSYVDLSEQFAEGLGSKAVTGKIMDALKTLKKDEFAALDSDDLRRAAGTLHAMYSSQAKQKNPVREDFLNMLAIMRDEGLKGLQKAYRNPEAFLPAVALTLGAGATAGSSEADQ